MAAINLQYPLLFALLLACMAKAQVIKATNTSAMTQACAGSIPGFRIESTDCKVLCRQAKWTDVLIFFLANHVAHAATTISRPGQSIGSTILLTLQALTIPSLGMLLAVMTISRGLSKPRWHGIRSYSLQKAAGAGALFAVVKVGAGQSQTGERPRGEVLGNMEMGSRGGPLRAKKDPNKKFSTKIHGVCELPEGYDLVMVQPDAEFAEADEQTVALSCNFNVAKCLISIAQLGFSLTTLYRAQGSQLERFGWAAYGLSVAPYAWMTLLNLSASLACPEYDRVYIVGSQGLDDLERCREAAGPEAESRFQVTGVISRLRPPADECLQAFHKRACKDHDLSTSASVKGKSGRLFWLTMLASVVPLVIVLGISRAQPGESSTWQRTAVMIWLVYGTFAFIWTVDPVDQLEGRPILEMRKVKQLGRNGIIIAGTVFTLLTVFSLPTFTMMILDFGVCKRL
ncbi:hypothetical protein RB595_003585 [Gaeumannomyces hyphopodioides]